MARKGLPLNDDDLLRRYQAGESGTSIAAAYGVGAARVYDRLRSAGVAIRKSAAQRRRELDVVDLRSRYENGASVKGLAEHFGVSRPVVTRRLRELGIEPRGRSEANLVRFAAADAATRRRQTAAANRATRKDAPGRFDPRPAYSARRTEATAEHRSRLVGKGESELFDLLIARGLSVMTQVPVYGYNIDLAVGTVAVEIWGSPGYPLRHGRQACRTVDLGDLGWSTLHVWLGSAPPTEATADAVVAFLDLVGGSPAPIGAQYRVIRGDGQVVTGGESKRENLTLEPTSGDGTY